MDSVASSIPYVPGAFTCYLCRKTFNYEVKTTKGNLIDLHLQAHISRFFNDIFGREEVRNAFYNYHKRIITMATFQRMGDTM